MSLIDRSPLSAHTHFGMIWMMSIDLGLPYPRHVHVLA